MGASAEHVRASVLVLAYRKVELLERCLSSLAAHGSRCSFEVRVVANGVTPDVETVVRRAGVPVVWSRANRGFAGGCNLGAGGSSAEFVVLLNDDAEPEAGWLDALVDAADAHPDAGAVGSLVLFPDGTVQDAGGVVWREGATAVIGRGAPADDPAPRTAGPVDYASGCALLVRRRAWDEVGGMDEGYFPAYYEDVDLCFSLRSKGWRIWLEPAARVRHAESASTDPTAKAIAMATSEARFRDKWRHVLERQLSHRGEPDAQLPAAVATARRRPRRVLIVDDRVPAPGLGSGFGRMWDIVHGLSGRGVQVTLMPTVVPEGNRHLERLGVEVTHRPVEWLADPENVVDRAIVSRPNNAGLADLIRRAQPWATVVYDAESLYWRRLERELELTVDERRRAAIGEELALVRPAESTLRARFDGVVAICPEERDWLSSQPGACPVTLIEPRVPPRHIDTRPFHARRHVVFVASWLAGGESPNGDGLRWFARHVVPILRRRLPGSVVVVTGGHVPPDLRRFESASLRFTGHVPDLERLYGSARVAVAPVRFGAGVKIKTVEALLHGVPTVTTTCGAEGVPDDLLVGARIADDAHAFAGFVTELAGDERAWTGAHGSLVEAARLRLSHHRASALDEWLDFLDQAAAVKGAHL